MNDPRPLKPKRRWYQFRLRTLLVATLALGVLFAWLGYRLQQAKKNREAAAEQQRQATEIEKAGGYLHFESVEPPDWVGRLLGDPGIVRIVGVSVSNPSEFDDAALGHLIRLINLKGLTNLEFLGLGHSEITDAGLGHLKGMTHLERLWLTDTQVTDAGMKRLKGLTNLERLDLSLTGVTDAGLEHLKALASLKRLWLTDTQVTDAGLTHLKDLTDLELLDLNRTQVTDAGLERLRGLISLQRLNLESTQVSGEGVKEFQRALPKCRIWYKSMQTK